MTDLPSHNAPGGPPPGPGSGPQRPLPSPWGQAPEPAGGGRGAPVQGPAPAGWGQGPQPSPWGPEPGPPPISWAPRPAAPAGPTGFTRASNATLAMVLSVSGLLCCGVLSVVGMVMARNDIDAMNQGITDPDTRNRAEAAFAVGIVGTVLALATIGFWVFVRFVAMG